MANRLELMLEAERRGILGAPDAALLAEARKRGMVHGGSQDRATTRQSIGPPGNTYSDQLTADISGGISGQSAVDMQRAMYEQTAQEASATDTQFEGPRMFGQDWLPAVDSERFRESTAKALPMVGATAAALAVPGPGWGALALQSLAASGGAAAGDMARQQVMNREVSVPDALVTGAEYGAGNLAGGALLKGLGVTARSIFSSGELKPDAKQAAGFASKERAPFPLSFAQPSVAQRGTGQTLAGKIGNYQEATKVAHYLNRHVGTITENASPVDAAASKGQQYLRKVFEPGEVAVHETFQKYLTAVGDDAAIPISRTLTAVNESAEQLTKRGETKAILQRLNKIRKARPDSFTAKELDELYGALTKEMRTNSYARPEAGRVLTAINKDLDDFGKGHGLNFSDDLAKANAARDELRELRKIPGLQRFSRDFGKGGTADARQWMSELFANPDGKALAELRSRNPELYHELADSWLAQNISGFSKYSEAKIGRTLDGVGLRQWFEQNQPALKVIYGKQQTEAYDNFTLYARFMSGASAQAGAKQDAAQFLWRGGASITAAKVGGLPIVIPTEAAAYVLARGLSNPSSTLFRVFTSGFSPTTRTVMRRGGQLAGQAVADTTNRSNDWRPPDFTRSGGL